MEGETGEERPAKPDSRERLGRTDSGVNMLDLLTSTDNMSVAATGGGGGLEDIIISGKRDSTSGYIKSVRISDIPRFLTS